MMIIVWLTAIILMLISCGSKEKVRIVPEEYKPGADTTRPQITEIPNEYIIYFTKKVNDSLQHFLVNQLEELKEKTRVNMFINKLLPQIGIHPDSLKLVNQMHLVIHLTSDQLMRMKNNPGLLHVEKEYQITQKISKPMLAGGNEEIRDWAHQRVCNSIRNNTTYSKRVWILDTGVDKDNEELNVNNQLSKSYFPGKTFYDVQGDANAHGTEVAGIIGAKVNGRGSIGVAPNAEIIAVKVMHNEVFRMSYYLDGLQYINNTARPGDIVNISLQNTPGSALEQEIILEMAQRGIQVVISAGNYRLDIDHDSVYPAKINHPNIFTVSAFSKGDNFCSFSNYGSSVDIAGPGEAVFVCLPNNLYGFNSGTSFSAPYIAGLLFLSGNLRTDGEVNNDPDTHPDKIGHE